MSPCTNRMCKENILQIFWTAVTKKQCVSADGKLDAVSLSLSAKTKRKRKWRLRLTWGERNKYCSPRTSEISLFKKSLWHPPPITLMIFTGLRFMQSRFSLWKRNHYIISESPSRWKSMEEITSLDTLRELLTSSPAWTTTWVSIVLYEWSIWMFSDMATLVERWPSEMT